MRVNGPTKKIAPPGQHLPHRMQPHIAIPFHLAAVSVCTVWQSPPALMQSDRATLLNCQMKVWATLLWSPAPCKAPERRGCEGEMGDLPHSGGGGLYPMPQPHAAQRHVSTKHN